MLKEIRKKMIDKELNQKQLGELIGVNEPRINAILKGIKSEKIRLDTLQRVLEVLDLKLNLESK